MNSKINKNSLALRIKSLEGLTSDEKSALIGLLNSRKKYGLVWEEKEEAVEELLREKLPVLTEVVEKRIIAEGSDNAPDHILIEGDNLHALTALQYTHLGQVDVAYFDPPYNTGARDWTYNNDYVDSKDQWRHSKWISMMHKRLLLAKHLLSPTGVIMVAIDDHEIHNTRHMLDEIMGEENYIATFCIEVNPAGQNIRENAPAVSHDYCLIYAKHIDSVVLLPRKLTEKEAKTYKESDDNGYFVWDNLRRRGGNSTPKDRPGQWYPIFANFESGELSLENFSGAIEVWPIDPKGIKRIWRVNPDGFLREYEDKNISVIYKANRHEIVKKSYMPEGRKPKTIWKDGRYSATTYGTKLLMEILGTTKFSYPKSLYLVYDNLMYYANPSSVILDFFAGSGTTLHAVMQLNRDDGGHRKCILVTNNEMKEDQKKELLQKGVEAGSPEFEQNGNCQMVTYSRIKSVIQGYTKHGTKNKKIDVPGLTNNNLRYYKTSFIDREPSMKNRKALTRAAVDLLCIRENCYEPLKKHDAKEIRVFTGKECELVIIFDPADIDDAIEIIESLYPEDRALRRPLRLRSGDSSASGLKKPRCKVYVFAPGHYAYDEEFESVIDKIELCALPEAIYRAYKAVLPKVKRKFLDELEQGGQG